MVGFLHFKTLQPKPLQPYSLSSKMDPPVKLEDDGDGLRIGVHNDESQGLGEWRIQELLNSATPYSSY